MFLVVLTRKKTTKTVVLVQTSIRFSLAVTIREILKYYAMEKPNSPLFQPQKISNTPKILLDYKFITYFWFSNF